MDHDSTQADFSPITVRVLVVSARPSLKRKIESMLDGVVESLRFARVGSVAERMIEESPCDLVIVDRALPGEDGLEVLERLSDKMQGVSGVMIVESPSAEDAVRAMRAGACDLISPRTRTSEVLRRVRLAAKRAERNRQRDQRIGRLRKLCHTLKNAQMRVSAQVGDMCNDLVDAYRDMSEQLTDVRMTGELETLLRQELEIEGLLRTVLEYTLARLGPTNAAVFLPSSSGEFSLGAYVNHDVPKDHAEVMLDHLADSLAPAFEDREGVQCMSGSAEIESWLGCDAHWLEDRTVLVYACRREGECLGVLTLFRDQGRSFSEANIRAVNIIGGLFAAQLERVIRVHHRHLPKHKWGVFDPPAQDDGDEWWDDWGMAA
ncbi:MAG: response regulator [Planctomycetota bacterium]|nr:MAG: response regulator [Planctomycetota bacterium]